MYLDMAQAGATLDTAAAAIMISQYRQNNGLGTVVVDPELTRLAEQQSQAMAARNKMDHNVKGPLDKRLSASGYPATRRGRKYLGRLSHPGGGVLRLARLAAAQGQYAQERCHKIGHRGELMLRTPNTRCSGRSSWHRPETGPVTGFDAHRAVNSA